VENLKKGSLLGIDRKEGQIDGPTGFITKPAAAARPESPALTTPSPAKENTPANPAASTKAAVPSVSLAQPATGVQEAKVTNP